MLTPTVTPLSQGSAHKLDPSTGSAETITLAAELLEHEATVYDQDPTGGNPSRY